MGNRKIVIVNQAVNYLTIGIANEFIKNFDKVILITGSVHVQGEKLDPNIKIVKIIKWRERPLIKKLFSYILSTIQIYFILIFKFRRYEILFISLPPWAYLLNLFLPNQCSMLIWDVYPDIFKITGIYENNLIFRIWSWLNKKSFAKALKLFTIGEKTSDLLAQYIDKSKILLTPIWSAYDYKHKILKENNIFLKQNNLNGKFIVQYSGNIGITHNVEYIIDIAEKLKNNSDIIFQIIGRGPKLSYIKSLIQKKSLTNCFFLPFQCDEIFPHSLSAADIGIVILDERVANGSVPSKSYNLMAFGIPSLYIASKSSELFSYTKKYKHGECYEKNELDNALDFILRLYKDKEKYVYYSKNAVKASVDFRRENADKIIEYYLK